MRKADERALLAVLADAMPMGRGEPVPAAGLWRWLYVRLVACCCVAWLLGAAW